MLRNFSLLDLRKDSSSVINSFKKRLALEEFLLRHDPLNRCWLIVGCHDPELSSCGGGSGGGGGEIVLGIGGKPHKLVDLALQQRDKIKMLKRFSGGGTVVLDRNSLLTTFIGRNLTMDDVVKPFPRNLMSWSYDMFRPAFSSLRLKTVSTPQSSSSHPPTFQLKENDYVLNNLKIGGNAQSIVKGGWLHHTSFLWDYTEKNMAYLQIPESRPDYRGDRDHGEFLTKLSSIYEGSGEAVFFDALIENMRGDLGGREEHSSRYDLKEENIGDVMGMVGSQHMGGFDHWVNNSGGRNQSRTRHID